MDKAKEIIQTTHKGPIMYIYEKLQIYICENGKIGPILNKQ
jgi:hypothetical protein